jgi:hypothetical protein
LLLISRSFLIAFVCRKTTSIDLSLVEHIPGKAGDAVIFMGGAVPHGTFLWEGKEHGDRRCVIQFYLQKELGQDNLVREEQKFARAAAL